MWTREARRTLAEPSAPPKPLLQGYGCPTAPPSVPSLSVGASLREVSSLWGLEARKEVDCRFPDDCQLYPLPGIKIRQECRGAHKQNLSSAGDYKGTERVFQRVRKEPVLEKEWHVPHVTQFPRGGMPASPLVREQRWRYEQVNVRQARGEESPGADSPTATKNNMRDRGEVTLWG